PPTTTPSTSSLHAALPISCGKMMVDKILQRTHFLFLSLPRRNDPCLLPIHRGEELFRRFLWTLHMQSEQHHLWTVSSHLVSNGQDRKSTRLNSSHVKTSYA